MDGLALPAAGSDCADGGGRSLFGLSLCAGAGGLDLGLHIAMPAYRTICYVERDAYAAATLVARMADAALDRAPVWDDVATFDGRPWRGIVDLVHGGYGSVAYRGRFRAALSRPNAGAGTGKKRLEARCKWHYGGGPEYCASCADAGLPCSKGKPNAQGNLCPYAEHEPQTVEGWEAWDIALRCAGQLRMTQFAVIGIDMNAALKIAETLGHEVSAVANFLPACESGMVSAINARLSSS